MKKIYKIYKQIYSIEYKKILYRVDSIYIELYNKL